MSLRKHLVEQPFIAATGAAALVHSTWALAVLFSGEPPAWDVSSRIAAAITLGRWAYWLLPALLIAFALDVGQIATSAEIRAGQRTPAKYITFIVFAVATYYLQWLYIAHHMPALELGPGVYTEGFAARVVLLTRNAAIWFIPALLPLSTTMYTLSGAPVVTKQAANKPTKPGKIAVSAPEKPAERSAIADRVTEQADSRPAQIGKPHPEYHIALCPSCGWEGSKNYTNATSAARALAAHRRTCPALHPEKFSNGHEGRESEK